MAARPSGLVQDDRTGNCVIPASVRADGSVRKERRVRPGFLPLEDVPRFRSRRLLERQETERREGQARMDPSHGEETVPKDTTKGSPERRAKATSTHASLKGARPKESRSQGAPRTNMTPETLSKDARKDASKDPLRDDHKAAPKEARYNTPTQDTQDAKGSVNKTAGAPRTTDGASSVDTLEKQFSSLSMQGISGG